tara:strand:- start:2824 stop:4128 length:1305 start_codon:yes stop_codon:yes gene_type:complete
MNYKLLVENWRTFLIEQDTDIEADIEAAEKEYKQRVLSASEDIENMNIDCYKPPAGTDLEEIIKLMVQLKYMPEDVDIGSPKQGQCSVEFDDAIRKAQEDLGFTGIDIDGILGKNTIKRLRAKAERMAKMVAPKSFTPKLMKEYTSVEVKEKITSQKTNAKTEQNKLIQLVKRKMGQNVSLGKRPDPYLAPEDPVLSQKWDVNIPLLMAFRSVEQDPSKGASSFLIMMNLFHSYTKFKFLDHPVVGYKMGHGNRKKVLKKLFKSGPEIDGSEKYVRKGGKTFIPHRPRDGYSHMSSNNKMLKKIFKLDKVATIRATSWGRFQVHPKADEAKRLSTDKDFLDVFINNTASKEKAEQASSTFLDGWLKANEGTFIKTVKSGNDKNNYDFSRLAAYYNGRTDGTKSNPQNYFYGQLLARQFQIAVDNFYEIIEKEEV